MTEISASGAEDRTNGDFLIGTTCYFCWVLRHTHACVHTNTHNLRNVSRRFECQGFPSCWPAVRAAAGLGCVAVCKETQRTTWQVLFYRCGTNYLSLSCAKTKHIMWYMWHIKGLSLESIHKNRKSHKADDLSQYFFLSDLILILSSKEVIYFSVLSAKCLVISYVGFFEAKGHYCRVIKCDLRDRTGTKSEDRHHKVCVCLSMLGRFTQFNRPGSSAVQLVSNCCPPYNASVPYPAQERTYHTFTIAFILFVQFTAMAEFLTDSNL